MSKIIRLRPHHILNLLRDDIHESDEQLKRKILAVAFAKKGLKYSERMADKAVEAKNAVIQGMPILLVPSIDDICECCNIWKEEKEHAESCPLEDDDISAYAVVSAFGGGNRGIYYPSDMFLRLKQEYEGVLLGFAGIHGNPVIEKAKDFCRKMLDNYTRFYEKLKHNGGN